MSALGGRDDYVLLSWLARQNDPFERHGDTYHVEDGEYVPGPTLTLLFDADSPYRGRVKDAVFLRRKDPVDAERLRATLDEIDRRDRHLRARSEVHEWDHADPTEHRAIYEFVRGEVADARRRFPARPLLVHVSPGTPAMHTVWVLLAASGAIDGPLEVVQSYRVRDRHRRPLVAAVDLEIETYLRIWRDSLAQRSDLGDEAILWDPQVTRAPAMKAAADRAARYAHLAVPVLLLGERGTGKTTLAAWIRTRGPFRRKDRKALATVACGQFSGELMRSELFGHRKGAFTGADRDRKGLLAEADGDTLFLDEIADLDIDVQRLLLRAIEEKEYEPLGASESKRSDFRLVTATNQPLPALRERLSPDFFDRVSYLRVTLPPLRERREDLPDLWRVVLARAAEQAGVEAPALRAAARDRILGTLARHPLPGNLRDLYRVAYMTLALGEDGIDEALATLNEDDGASPTPDAHRAVARAFATGASLGELATPDRPLDSEGLFDALKSWLADELPRAARRHGVRVERLVDRTDRTLRDWRKKSSA